jgi:photosynthetic reaction center cytochrome c subunit
MPLSASLSLSLDDTSALAVAQSIGDFRCASSEPMRVTRRKLLRAMGTALVCLLGIASAIGQDVPAQKPQMAEDVFKNVQVLRGISVDEFMGTMGFFAASLGLNCTDCHTVESSGDWKKYADDTPLKQTARRMILMVNTINRGNFGGKRMVTCYSCHRGTDRPKVTPSLAEQYSAPQEDPDEIEIVGQAPAPGTPTADQVLDKYIQALGGAQRLADLTSFVAKGTYEGYDTEFEKVPVEVFVKAPSQRTTIVHARIGDGVTTYDGRSGWIAAADKPVPLIALTGGDLDGAKVDADLSFPARIKQTLSRWQVDSATIDDREVQVVQGTSAGQSPVKLYFDKESGLLVRQVRYSDTTVGLNPTQIDYADYRQVAGVKMPFRWTVTWTDGRSTFELSEVQPNASIDAAKFARPAPAPPPKPATP